ncbi:MAG TPA: DNA starvation/stationary phase protection protein [Ktedonobacteraceae bacterium]
MATRTAPAHKPAGTMEGQPKLRQRSREIQGFQQLRSLPLEMPEAVIGQSITLLNQVVVDSITLYNLYKKHHWQMSGPTFYQLHLLLDNNAEEIEHSIDLVAERIQMLGGVTLGMPFDVAERTKIERPPLGMESVPAMLSRTVEAHAAVLRTVREGIELTQRNKDYGTNDMLVSDLLRMHEMQIWMLSQHLVDTPLACDTSGQRPD